MKNYEDKLLSIVQEKNKCYSACRRANTPCQESSCRLWIDYESDLNCTEIAVQNNGKMVFREIAARLNLTPSRIKQIETETMKKVAKKLAGI